MKDFIDFQKMFFCFVFFQQQKNAWL